MILVFAKAPVPGTVKTRLIPALGAEGAAKLHRRMVWHTMQAACATGGRVRLCGAPDLAHPFFAECAAEFSNAGFSLVAQAGIDLGARMAHAVEQALQTEERAILVGTDCPALQTGDLCAALDALKTHNHVFVPVEDGGYALVGARRGAGDMARIFDGIAWSTAQVMQQTRMRLAQFGASWTELATSWDVDEERDLMRLLQHDAGRSLLDGLFPAPPRRNGSA